MPDIISKLLEQLTPEGTVERCGIVTAAGKLIELDNIYENPIEGFRFSPQDSLQHLAGSKAASTWHTHPGLDPNLSEEDYAGFLQWPDLTHWIVGTREGEPMAIEYVVDNGLVVAK